MSERKKPVVSQEVKHERRLLVKDKIIGVLIILIVASSLAAAVWAYETQKKMTAMQERSEHDLFQNCRQTQILIELLRRTGGPALSLPSMCKDYDMPSFMLQK